jgi:hypothetical protein
MQSVRSSETSVNLSQTTRYHIGEYSTSHNVSQLDCRMYTLGGVLWSLCHFCNELQSVHNRDRHSNETRHIRRRASRTNVMENHVLYELLSNREQGMRRSQDATERQTDTFQHKLTGQVSAHADVWAFVWICAGKRIAGRAWTDEHVCRQEGQVGHVILEIKSKLKKRREYIKRK